MPRGSDPSHSNGRVSHPTAVNLFLDGDPAPAAPAVRRDVGAPSAPTSSPQATAVVGGS